MKRSVDRILTTHTGSLPRPAELVHMYARRAGGEAVDEGALDAAGRAAMRDVVHQQIASGIDVGNNGEQQREGFFLYVQRRMTGFGGSWKRWARGDVERYPAFKRALELQSGGKVAVSNFVPPRVVGEIHYKDPRQAEAEARDFKAALSDRKDGFAEAFLTAPSPGIIAAACKNEHYETEESYLEALGEAPELGA